MASSEGLGLGIESAIARAVLRLPSEQIEGLAQSLESAGSSTTMSLDSAINAYATPGYREAVRPITVAVAAHRISALAAALALRSAAAATAALRAEHEVDIVWTGPATPYVAVRRTREVLLELIDAARHDLVIVSFAAYKVPSIVEAIGRALDRGVQVKLALETTADSGGALSMDARKAFETLGDRVTYWVWPADRREEFTSQRAAQHVKAAIADDTQALVTSANLTGSGVSGNMELGVYFKGGPLPHRLASHFRELMAHDILRRVIS